MRRDVFDFACIGDSLTSGYVARNWTGEVVSRLSTRTSRPVVCYNVGQPGTMSDWGVAHISPVIQLRPRSVIIAFGMNDSEPSLNMSLLGYATNLRTIINAVRSGSPMTAIFLMTMNEIATDSADPALAGRKANVPSYYQALRTVSAEQNVALIDNALEWKGKTLAELPDGIHPDLVPLRQITIPNVTAALAHRL